MTHILKLNPEDVAYLQRHIILQDLKNNRGGYISVTTFIEDLVLKHIKLLKEDEMKDVQEPIDNVACSENSVLE
jgi:hypothetical protein